MYSEKYHMLRIILVCTTRCPSSHTTSYCSWTSAVCPAHPEVELSHIKLVFLPKNTTSRLQPCDAEIIQAVKLTYRKKMLHHMDECTSARELAKKIDVLDAICWLRYAWETVTLQTPTIQCGFKLSSPQVALPDLFEDDRVLTCPGNTCTSGLREDRRQP